MKKTLLLVAMVMFAMVSCTKKVETEAEPTQEVEVMVEEPETEEVEVIVETEEVSK